MTLDGTNTLVIRHPSSRSAVVVDPGPLEDGHLAALCSIGPIALILLTHHHLDHTEAADALHEVSGAPVRSFDPSLVRGEGTVLQAGETINAGGCAIRVIAAPGHTADSACFLLPDDTPVGGGPRGSVLTGDTILGRGTTVIAPTGSIADYLATLDHLAALGDLPVLPGHGDPLPSLHAIATELTAHRLARIDQVLAILAERGLVAATDDETVAQVSEALYPEVAESIRYAASFSTRAQLEYLAR